MTAYNIATPAGETITLNSKLNVAWAIWAKVDYGQGGTWQLFRTSSTHELAEKAAKTLRNKGIKTGFTTETWITYAEEVA